MGEHIIDKNCHELHGAAGVQILAFGGIAFWTDQVTTIQGPLSLTMGPGVDRLNVSALRSSGELRVVAPKGSLLQFNDITSSSAGAAMQAEHDLRLEGAGSIAFENIHSERSGGALRTWRGCVYTHVAHLSFRNCSSRIEGGAIYSPKCIGLNNSNADDTVTFETCTASWRGGAVCSGEVRLTGKGTYLFSKCHSESEGGAVGTYDDMVIGLQPGGSACFRHCTARGFDTGGRGAVGGGAVYSARHINITTGRVLFSACSAATHRGHAMDLFQGTLNMGLGSQVTLADMEGAQGPAIRAAVAMLPPDGDVLPSDVFATQGVFASQALSERGDKTCPAGSRFSMVDGHPESSKCKICTQGTASLAPAFLQSAGEVTTPAPGMKLVLVHRSSPNSLQSLGVPLASRTSFGLTDQCRTDNSSCLGFKIGPYDGYWSYWMDPFLTLELDYTDKLALTFQDGNLREPEGGLVAVPWRDYAPGLPLALIQPGQTVGWNNVNASEMFRMDEQGIISPEQAPFLALGLDREVSYKFDPDDPIEACAPCHEIAAEQADKIWCPGSAHVQSIAGYMLSHREGNRTLEIHACPNKDACPGSNFSATAKGATSSKSRLCAMGYEPTPGCVRCAHHYGRPQLDPFVCKA